MAGLHIPHVLMVLCAITALNCASTLPRDIVFPTANENLAENSEPIAYPPSLSDQPLKTSEQEDKPKGCFHFYVSRNMSSLLAEATKMLRTIRDRREREWILTFIYRIKSLAEHLRAHPDSRNYDCLSNDEEARMRLSVRGQQPELYFVDDVPKRSGEGEAEIPEKSVIEKDNQQSTDASAEQSAAPNDDPPRQETESSRQQPSAAQLRTESSAETASDSTLAKSSDDERRDTSQDDATTSVQVDESVQKGGKDVPAKRERTEGGDIVLSSAASDCGDLSPDCSRNVQVPPSSQIAPENYFADAGNIYPLYQSDDTGEQEFNAEELYQREALKRKSKPNKARGRIRKALLEELAPEIKKLRTVGGTENDLLSIWNSNYVQEDKSAEENEDSDFDYEETGAAAGDLNLNEKILPDRTVAPSLDEVQNSKENLSSGRDSSYEPYDDSDVLVQQLFDVRYNNPPSKTTKSLSDQNNEYLITSTHTPF